MPKANVITGLEFCWTSWDCIQLCLKASGHAVQQSRASRETFLWWKNDPKTHLQIHVVACHHLYHCISWCPCIQADMLAIIWQCAQFLIFTAMEWLRLALEAHPLLENSWNDNTQSHLLVPCGNDLIFVTSASRTKCTPLPVIVSDSFGYFRKREPRLTVDLGQRHSSESFHVNNKFGKPSRYFKILNFCTWNWTFPKNEQLWQKRQNKHDHFSFSGKTTKMWKTWNGYVYFGRFSETRGFKGSIWRPRGKPRGWVSMFVFTCLELLHFLRIFGLGRGCLCWIFWQRQVPLEFPCFFLDFFSTFIPLVWQIQNSPETWTVRMSMLNLLFSVRSFYVNWQGCNSVKEPGPKPVHCSGVEAAMHVMWSYCDQCETNITRAYVYTCRNNMYLHLFTIMYLQHPHTIHWPKKCDL